MAVLTVNEVDWDGFNAASAYVAAAASQEFPNDGRTFVHVKNTNGSSRTITFVTAGTVRGHPIANPTVTIGDTTGDKMIGPFEESIYNPDGGNISITWSATAGVTIAVFKLAR